MKPCHLLTCLLLVIKAEPAAAGAAALVVYPDYPIDSDSSAGTTTIPGHAGVLLVSDAGGTKYFEFGRYQPEGKDGLVRLRSPIPDVTMSNGVVQPESLKPVFKELSLKAGKSTDIRAAWFINMDYNKMLTYAENSKKASDRNSPYYDKDRKKYDLTTYNCAHFAEEVILKGNAKVDRPTILQPTPINFVDEYIEEQNGEITYSVKSGAFSFKPGDESDAKLP